MHLSELVETAFFFGPVKKLSYKNSRACHRRKFMTNVNVLQVHMLLHKKVKKEKLIPKQHYNSVTYHPSHKV